MKIRPVVTLVLLAGLTLAALPAWADSQTATGSFLAGVLNPNAKGTKLSGPLTIYFAPSATVGTSCSGDAVDMFMFVRLKLGTNVYGFSRSQPSGTGAASICFSDVSTQIPPVRNFFNTTVKQTLQSISAISPSAANFELKSLTDLVTENVPQPPPLFFAVMDIVLAVQE